MDWNEELLKSARIGDLERVKECLTNGANVNARDSDGQTALIITSYRGMMKNEIFFEISKLLVQNGIDVNAQDNDGWTALMAASYHGQFGIMEFLIENGADVNIAENNDNTALIFASSLGHFEIVKFLVENGADINAENKDGKTALDKAEEENVEIKEFLISAGAKYARPLIKFVQIGDLDKIKECLANGIDVNEKDNDGWTALMFASSNGDLEIVKLLLTKGANVNIKDNDGRTALMYASYNGYFEIVKCLINNGADVYAKDNGDTTVLHYARTDEIKEFLIKASAKNGHKNVPEIDIDDEIPF